MVKRKEHPGPSFPRGIQLHPAARGTTNADATGPFAAYFASGYCPSKNDSATFEVHRHVERPREHCLLLRKDGIDFVGSTANVQGPPSCRYAVGLLDKRTGEVRYAEVNGGHIIRMEPRARGTHYGPTGHKTELEETAQARRAQNERLVHAFGSTRRQRQLKQKDLAQVVGENVEASGAVKEILGAAAEKAAQAKATKDEIIKAVTGIRHIPPHHAEAMTASEAYRLEELMPAGVWDAIDVSSLTRGIADLEYRGAVLRDEYGVPDYVLDRLAVITKPHSQSGSRRLHALAFLGALMRLYTGRPSLRARARDGLRGLAARTGVQVDVLQPLLEQYYSAEGGQEEGDMVYSRTKEQGRALLLTLLMTALIAEDYNMGGRHYETLRAALKLTPQELINFYREMGCSTDRQAEPSSPLKQYRVRLLPEGPPGMPAKKLADAFPKLAVPRARTR